MARGGAAAQYVIQTASQAVPREAYQVGPLHFGLAERGGVTALDVRTGGAAARVALLSARGQSLAPVMRRGGWAVYRVPGRAGTVRVALGHTVLVLAWAARSSPRQEAVFWGGAFGASGPWVTGFSGSWRFDGPGGSTVLTPVATLRSGVLAWSAPHHYWLLPPKGPALPVWTGHPFSGENPLVLAAPYPGASNEILVSGPLGSGSARWWNLASDRYGTTPIGSGDSVWPTSFGWVDASGGADVVLSYAAPPRAYFMPGQQVAGVAWAHRVLVSRMQGSAVASTGVYSWRTQRYTPVRVPPANASAAVALPHWGPTYLESSPREGASGSAITVSNFVFGPATVSLVRAGGGPGASIALPAGATLTPGLEWVVLQSGSGLPNVVRVGWPNAAGQFQWHVIAGPADGMVTVANSAIYWATPHHMYVWMPPFARP